MPFLSDALLYPLSVEVRTKYLDRYMARMSAAPPGCCAERWLAYHDSESLQPYHEKPQENSPWRLKYLQKTMRVERTIHSGAPGI